MQLNPDLIRRVRAALKQKWQADDHELDLDKMMVHFKVGRMELLWIIAVYENELLNTRFNVVENALSGNKD